MRYQRLDLNLLTALRALLAEQNVTRAAQAMHITQPAMSGILARLREYFGDPLITQVGRKMELTPLARSLVGPINDLLVRIDATLGIKPEFEPASTRRRFTMVASDYVVNVLLVDVLRRVHQAAPGITIELRQPARESAVQLEAGEIDLLVTPEVFASGSHSAVNLFDDGYCAVVDRDHPEVGDSIGLAQYLQLGHVCYESLGKPFFESWFDRAHGEIRQVQVVTPTYSLLPQLVAGTRLVATLHARAAARLDPSLPLRRVRLDFAVPRLTEVLQWHQARDLDPGAQWLRQLIVDAAAQLPSLSSLDLP
ncbi:LysR family transcriptional regulator [Ramlibacter sp. G-1-2-2]|uniref:LysR family transcriptional regulator n=1 Tax=Ramlibacter agri TaxID=2728837 RepID=A0A848HCJ8_9BURK|nr:LysR family transcriptional regulator [Ramlibacter agri]NML47111.1 LysR family transcriptional regulator [Ramlibacter agri]